MRICLILAVEQQNTFDLCFKEEKKKFNTRILPTLVQKYHFRWFPFQCFGLVLYILGVEFVEINWGYPEKKTVIRSVAYICSFFLLCYLLATPGFLGIPENQLPLSDPSAMHLYPTFQSLVSSSLFSFPFNSFSLRIPFLRFLTGLLQLLYYSLTVHSDNKVNGVHGLSNVDRSRHSLSAGLVCHNRGFCSRQGSQIPLKPRQSVPPAPSTQDCGCSVCVCLVCCKLSSIDSTMERLLWLYGAWQGDRSDVCNLGDCGRGSRGSGWLINRDWLKGVLLNSQCVLNCHSENAYRQVLCAIYVNEALLRGHHCQLEVGNVANLKGIFPWTHSFQPPLIWARKLGFVEWNFT